jgi:hypothetical protein
VATNTVLVREKTVVLPIDGVDRWWEVPARLFPVASAEAIAPALISLPLMTGMEMAVVGMCVGQEIEVDIPPLLGFDEPAKRFSRTPVPHVRLHLHLHLRLCACVL